MKTLTASGSDTVRLGQFYDYTINHEENYNVIVVRNEYTYKHLEFVYGRQAVITLDPNVLNLKSQGKWITGYIELPNGYNVNDINVSTVELWYGRGNVKAELQPTAVGDYDKDNIPDRMVKFDRQKVIKLFQTLQLPVDIELRVVGNLKDGAPFAGSDIIRVIEPGSNSGAKKVIAWDVRGSNNQHANPEEALGISDGKFVSLGVDGWIALDMGKDKAIVDSSGDDFIIESGSVEKSDGSYQVFISNDPIYWTFLGSGTGTSTFDLSNSGFSEARYIKIVDDGDGDSLSSAPGCDLDAIIAINLQTEVGVEQVSDIQNLLQVFPNPLVGQTTIRYGVAKSTLVSLQVYDISGRLVHTLVEGGVKPGYYTIALDSKKLTSGIYFLNFSAGEYKAMWKLILVK